MTGRHVAFKAIADLISLATSFLTFPLIARAVGVDGYGAWLQAMAVIGVLNPFASAGLVGAVLKYLAVDDWTVSHRRLLRRVVVVSLATAAGLAALLFFFASPIGNVLIQGDTDVTPVFRSAALLLVGIVSEQLALNLLRARARLFAYSSYQLLSTVMMVLAVVTVLRWSGLAAMVAALGVWKLVSGMAIVAFEGARPTVPDGNLVPSIVVLIRYGIPLSTSLLSLWILNLGDRLVVGSLRGAADLGRYGAAYSMASVMVMANGALALPALPRMMRARDSGADALAEEVRIFHHYLILGLVPLAGLLVTLGPRVVQELGGAEFGVGIGVLLLVALGIALNSSNGLAHYVLVVTDRTVVLQNVTLLGALANVLLNIVIVPIFGIAGAAGVSALTFFVMEVTIMRYAEREAPIISAYDWRGLRRTVVASLVAGAAATPVLNAISSRVTALALAGMVYLIAVIAILALSKAITRTDVVMVRRLFAPTTIAGGQL